MFVSDQRYSSNVAASHDLFGANNDDPQWYLHGEVPKSNTPFSTQPEDYDGPGYTFTPDDEDDKDEIRKYNEQIRLWREALERNEREKYNAELLRNISFNAGVVAEYADQVETMKFTKSTYELDISASFLWEKGFSINKAGLTNSLSISASMQYGNSKGKTETETTVYGYVLSDPDNGDYFSIDVKDAKSGTGPVFAIKAGRSMCPYEDEVKLKYFLPGKFTITDSVLLELNSLGMSSDLYDILAWKNTDKFELKRDLYQLRYFG
ncbi:MAG: hypothetical protein HC831_30085 [Chloroflexia bacterium]|nr:hypothetical protein [Chloroflexia bacterium]